MTRPPVKAPTSSTPWLSRARDALLLLLGGGGFVYEAVIAPEPRALLIGGYLLMLGLPAFNGVDRIFQRPAAPTAEAPSENTPDTPAPRTPLDAAPSDEPADGASR